MGVAKQAGSVDEMKELFVGWDPILTSFLNNVKTVDKWKLMHSKYAHPTITIAGY
jgi:salicylate hydroxylase